jgi:hypothetical protein
MYIVYFLCWKISKLTKYWVFFTGIMVHAFYTRPIVKCKVRSLPTSRRLSLVSSSLIARPFYQKFIDDNCLFSKGFVTITFVPNFQKWFCLRNLWQFLSLQQQRYRLDWSWIDISFQFFLRYFSLKSTTEETWRNHQYLIYSFFSRHKLNFWKARMKAAKHAKETESFWGAQNITTFRYYVVWFAKEYIFI